MVLGLLHRVSDARDWTVVPWVEVGDRVASEAWGRYLQIAFDTQLLEVSLSQLGALDNHFKQLIRSGRLLERRYSFKLLTAQRARYATERIDYVNGIALLGACLAHEAVVS